MKVSILNFANFTEPWGVFHSTNSKNIETVQMARTFPEKISREFRSFWISKIRTIQKIGGKSNLGRKLEIAFPKISVHLAGCPLFRKFRKVLFHQFSVENFRSCWSHGKNLRISNFASCVYCAFRPTRMASSSESKWLLVRTWDIFRRKFTLPLLTWTFPKKYRVPNSIPWISEDKMVSVTVERSVFKLILPWSYWLQSQYLLWGREIFLND